MTTPAEYRRFALECMREAERADDAAMRLSMAGLARVWMQVALELDQQAVPASDDDPEFEPADSR
jgi:hypothetical protein